MPDLSRRLLPGAVALPLVLSLVLGAAAPAQAFGRNERKFVQGLAAGALLGAIYMDQRQRTRAMPPRAAYAPPQQVYTPPPVWQPAPQPVYYPPAQPVYRSSLYDTPAAAAFGAYAWHDRQRIQQHLAALGYYRGGADGAFGPGTYAAITAYAQDRGQTRALQSSAGAFGLYDSLLY